MFEEVTVAGGGKAYRCINRTSTFHFTCSFLGVIFSKCTESATAELSQVHDWGFALRLNVKVVSNFATALVAISKAEMPLW